MVIRRIAGKFKRAQRPMIRVIQKVILQGSLFFFYYIGMGISRAVMMVLARRMLYNRPRRRLAGETFWREAEGYRLDEELLPRQS